MGGLPKGPAENTSPQNADSLIGRLLKQNELAMQSIQAERKKMGGDAAEELVVLSNKLEMIPNGVKTHYELGETRNKKIEDFLNNLPKLLGDTRNMYKVKVGAGADRTGFSYAEFGLEKANRIFSTANFLEGLMPVLDEDSQKWANEVMESNEWLYIQDIMADNEVSEEDLEGFKNAFPKTFNDPRGALNFLATLGRAKADSDYMQQILEDLFTKGKITTMPMTQISLILGDKANDRSARFTSVIVEKIESEQLKILEKMSVPVDEIKDLNK